VSELANVRCVSLVRAGCLEDALAGCCVFLVLADRIEGKSESKARTSMKAYKDLQVTEEEDSS